MTDISLETVTGKLNRLGYDCFIQALRQAKGAGNANLELAHWFMHVLQKDRSDLAVTCDHYKLDRGKLLTDIQGVVNGFKKGVTEMPQVSEQIVDALERGWFYATLFFGEMQIRTGHVLMGMLKDMKLNRVLKNLSPEFGQLNADALAAEYRTIWADSDEESLRPMDGSSIGAPGTDAAQGPTGTTALDKFCVDLTARAKEMDPIVGRDEEIRQIIDILQRRRQNNPILTGEAGVGKTAVVEGFAQKIVKGEVPPSLQGVRLLALDIGLLQAGASMKGEFEQRLRSVIDEVQNSPTPIILFIDEAHTLIGAGGAAGTGDAANLLKPALARGKLRTIAATTWNEYQKYFEKDPALTRRFQVINVDEPSIEKCCYMLRGMISVMEKHHGVKVADEAIVAAAALSARYIPARQLPDKAVSLLDTACARVAISQVAVPAVVEDTRKLIEAREIEKASKEGERSLGTADETRIAELGNEIAALRDKLGELEGEWEKERGLVQEIQDLRAKLGAPQTPAPAYQGAVLEGAGAAAAHHAAVGELASGLVPPVGAGPAPSGNSSGPGSDAGVHGRLKERVGVLEAIHPDRRMIYAHVDEQAVATIISDWTGIPAGRMVADEVQQILNLAGIVGDRVIGQKHGIQAIAKRIQTNRAKLDNPNKPIGVFMLCGPSGVGKTETALALAEAIYGGEQNMITINMSEYQEAHTVSSLKGAPPGYVGYGEGGKLTEAVRRKPYSVVLLDEVEKAHGDVHEVFFQVFDKGMMEDGTGRRIDFKNTLIILTSNVGTDLIMEMTKDPELAPEPEKLAEALKPELLKVFPAALLGRLVVIPYYPLTDDDMGRIVKLQLGRITKRMKEQHDAAFRYGDDVVAEIVRRCNDPASGGRMIDNIITNTMLPAISLEILNRSLVGEEITEAEVGVVDREFTYAVH
jgi:type VI secretion system protein VasG